MFTKNFYSSNRQNLLSQIKNSALVVLTANGIMQSAGDCVFQFRQDSNFLYLTGLSELNDAILVLCEKEEFIILPSQSEVEAIFGGFHDSGKITEISGVESILSYRDGWERLGVLQKKLGNIHTIKAPAQKVTHTDSFYTNPARRRLAEKLQRSFKNIKLIDLSGNMTNIRQIKQPQEIDAIKEAISITGKGLIGVNKAIKEGVFEYDLEAELDYQFKKHASNHAFTPIVSRGANNCILHYTNGRDRVIKNDLILCDVGAEHQGYAADISRTYSVTKMSQRQKDVYGAVYSVQQLAIESLKPGISWQEYNKKVSRSMGLELIKLGLIKQNKQTEVNKYFPHGISHSLGLDVHDVCDYKIIQEKMVITVEPGIYIQEEAIGVRLEDDVLITKNGANNLSVIVN